MLSPTELIEKLVALVPPPRRNLIRYHGVLAPAAADRAQIVPGPRPLTELGVDGGQAGEAARHRHRVEWARRLARVLDDNRVVATEFILASSLLFLPVRTEAVPVDGGKRS